MAKEQNNGPLAGVKVLDLSLLLPGPLCSKHLADLGAEVIKVENPRMADGSRYMLGDGVPYLFLQLNRGKKAITVNFKRPDGQAVLKKILKDCDILLEGFRPEAMAKVGLDYESLKDEFPRLIYCSISGYGKTGPYKDYAGHDGNYISYSGLLGVTGDEKARPVLPGFQAADIAGGTLTALSGILAALYEREKTGRGQAIDVSMTDGAFALMEFQLAGYQIEKKDPRPGQSMLSGGLPNYHIYETRDGRFVMLGALEERFFRSFLRSQGREDALEGRKLGENPDPKDLAELKKILTGIFAEKDFGYWQNHFSNPDICLSPVNSISEVIEDPQLKERAMVRREKHPEFGEYLAIGTPFRLSNHNDLAAATPPPGHGEHTREILSDLGYTPDEMEELKKKRAI